LADGPIDEAQFSHESRALRKCAPTNECGRQIGPPTTPLATHSTAAGGYKTPVGGVGDSSHPFHQLGRHLTRKFRSSDVTSLTSGQVAANEDKIFDWPLNDFKKKQPAANSLTYRLHRNIPAGDVSDPHGRCPAARSSGIFVSSRCQSVVT
jgi:hypothetical protein